MDDRAQLFTINLDGTGLVGLTPAGVNDYMPDWTRRSSEDNVELDDNADGNDEPAAPKCRAP